jgi:proteasome lid subunit RPN8/RPN11
VHFHHELCDDRGSELSLELTEEAKFRLYETLHGSGLKLVALIHTHPESWVGLSHIDQRNQVCSRIGFWSLVVPNYGRRPWDLFALGVHIRADNGWYQVPKAKIADRIIISG